MQSSESIDTCEGGVPVPDGFNNDETPDFSQLPDVAWITIMQQLSVRMRYNVAKTCKRLYEIFDHPSLWYSQTLKFMGDADSFTHGIVAQTTSIPADDYVNLVHRFGKYFQNLKIKVVGHFKDLSDEMIAVLHEISEQCRLKRLTIDAGCLTSRIHDRWGVAPNKEAIIGLINFVKCAYRMKHLDLKSWPMHRAFNAADCNIFDAIAGNEKLVANLESLSLFRLDGTEDWSEKEPILPTPAVIQKLIEKCTGLTSLALRSPMLNKEVIETLASPERTRLEELQIVIHYIDHNRKPAFAMPVIPPRVWQALLSRCPHLKVECIVLLKTPHIELANLLSTEVPLSAITYMKYSQIDPQTVAALFNNHNKTLKSFRSYCDSSYLDQELIQLAKSCSELTEFVYHGNLNSETVIEIAKTKGEMWGRFEVKEANIKVLDEFAEVDEDEVITRRPDGEYVMVGLMRFHQPEEYRHQVIADMVQQVTSVLKTPWKPIM